jgi:hypothetical protein
VLQPAPVSLHDWSAFVHGAWGQMWAQRPLGQPPGGQVVLHAHAPLQSTPPRQEVLLPQLTSHRDPPQSIVFQQVP